MAFLIGANTVPLLRPDAQPHYNRVMFLGWIMCLANQLIILGIVFAASTTSRQ